MSQNSLYWKHDVYLYKKFPTAARRGKEGQLGEAVTGHRLTACIRLSEDQFAANGGGFQDIGAGCGLLHLLAANRRKW